MPTQWHPTITAREIHNTRQENWNDINPSVTTTLMVADADINTFVWHLIRDRVAWPLNSEAPSPLYCSSVEKLPIGTAYRGDAVSQEIIVTDYDRLVRVTYTNNTDFLRSVITTPGTGTATDYGYESQDVWVTIQRIVSTEFLKMDYNEFCYHYIKDGGDKYPPLLPDESPGRVLRTVKYVCTFKNIYLTDDLEDIIYNYSGTVNNSALTTHRGIATFEPEQVLFNIEDVTEGLRKLSGLNVIPLNNLRVSFHCRMCESTWNKFWKAKRSADGLNDGSGWVDIHHKKIQGEANPPKWNPFSTTNYWYPLWVI
jgi:hypothetical protein